MCGTLTMLGLHIVPAWKQNKDS
uniref:Uncharacterized protein n=1 Tax=Arundo donax TaxID=35708 RepID=A0A0A9C565_ARUDO